MDRARQLAGHLARLGVKPDGRVGVLLERSLEMIVGLLGVLEAGAAYVPLDPTLPAERLATLVESAGLSAVVTQERHVGVCCRRRVRRWCASTPARGPGLEIGQILPARGQALRMSASPTSSTPPARRARPRG